MSSTVMELKEIKHKIASYQTERFPIPSISGNRYVHIIFDYDTNLIQAAAIKSRDTDDMIAAYEK